MNIAEFVDRHGGQATGHPLDEAGPHSRALREILGSEKRTRMLLATNFWQSLIASPARHGIESRLGLVPDALEAGRAIIVPRATMRQDLLVFSPLPRPDEVRVTVVEAGGHDLVEGWHAWMRQQPAAAALRRLLSPGTAVEAGGTRHAFSFVVTRTPDTELLSVPQPAAGGQGAVRRLLHRGRRGPRPGQPSTRTG